jgi:pimeloyl-ACP methyl ester carboxylesterase
MKNHKGDRKMKQKLSITTLLLIGIILMNLVCFISIPISFSQEKKQSPQEQSRIPEISTPKTDSMIDVGGRKLHCCVYGKGSPSVVLVSGFGALQAYWNSVIPDLAAKTTVVTYDRAGIGKSEIGDLPTHGEQAAKDLLALLKKLDVPKPYLLVGHSYGGSVVRLFASMYPDDMGGLILEDAQHEDVLDEQRKILTGKDLEALEQMVARFSTPENPRTEADYRNITTEQVRKSKPLPHIPFIVLTAGDRSKAMLPMFSDEAKERIAKLGLKMQQKLVALIPGGKQIIVEGAGHIIHGEKPEALIAPVVEIIKEIRENK